MTSFDTSALVSLNEGSDPSKKAFYGGMNEVSDKALQRLEQAKAKFAEIRSDLESRTDLTCKQYIIPLFDPKFHLVQRTWSTFQKHVLESTSSNWSVERREATQDEKKRLKIKRKYKCFYINAIYKVPDHQRVAIFAPNAETTTKNAALSHDEDAEEPAIQMPVAKKPRLVDSTNHPQSGSFIKNRSLPMTVPKNAPATAVRVAEAPVPAFTTKPPFSATFVPAVAPNKKTNVIPPAPLPMQRMQSSGRPPHQASASMSVSKPTTTLSHRGGKSRSNPTFAASMAHGTMSTQHAQASVPPPATHKAVKPAPNNAMPASMPHSYNNTMPAYMYPATVTGTATIGTFTNMEQLSFYRYGDIVVYEFGDADKKAALMGFVTAFRHNWVFVTSGPGLDFKVHMHKVAIFKPVGPVIRSS